MLLKAIKLNKDFLIVGHNVDGLKVMKKDKFGKFQIIKTYQDPML